MLGVRRSFAAATVGLLLLGACADASDRVVERSSSTTPSTTTPAAAPSSIVTPTSTDPGATPEQAAAVIGRHRPEFLALMEQERCGAPECLTIEARTERRRRLTELAVTMSGGLRDLGPLDPEVADLALATSEAAIAVFDEWDAVTRRCVERHRTRSIGPCEDELASHGELLVALETLLRRWAPAI